MELILNRFEWSSPWILAFLLVIPLLAYRLYRNHHAVVNGLYYPNIQRLPTQRSWKLRLFKLLPLLRLLTLCFMILALAGPRWLLKEEKINAEGISIFMVMDLSSSMLSQDFEPNRLEVSKLLAVDFIAKRPYDRIGLTAFSGEAFTQCPLTTDHDALKSLLMELKCGLLEDGTAIGMGLASAINRLHDDTSKSKVIILITDGVNNAGDISPAVSAELAKSYQIKIYSIGVGTNGEAYSPVGRSPHGEYVFGMAPVNIDEELLKQISQYTGAKYYRAINAAQFAEIYSEIDQLEKTKIDVKYIKRYSEEFRFFLWIAVTLLLMEWLLRFSLLRVNY